MNENKITLAYLRVSGGPGQDVASQRKPIQDLIDRMKWRNVEWIEDVVSGRKKKRKEFLHLCARAKSGWVARIVVFKVDRIGRNARENLELAEYCKERNCDIVGAADGTSLLGPNGSIMFGLLSLLAEREWEDTSARTKAGMAVAKADKKVIGGGVGGLSKRVFEKLPIIRILYKQGLTAYAISKAVSLDYDTVRPICRNIDGPWETRQTRLRRVPPARRGKKYQEAIKEAEERKREGL